ncbi:MAG: 7-cyano-7-deazaguanine synthase QueC [Oxalobacteraceae bacterium]|nr:7-cyano-7-deazaguanine synthase QueC [Oxalobacteraceae bacterium]
MSRSALVLFSGGQDSATCLAWALTRYEHVETLGFHYGQRHQIELERRPIVISGLRQLNPEWSVRLADDHMLNLGILGDISDTALTRETEIAMQENGLPNTFVPGRNILFLTVAAALAYRRGIKTLVGGMCETDYSGYPDCRDESLRALEHALQLGMQTDMTLETPLMWLTKAATWTLADTLGGKALVELIRTETHTCYLGQRDTLHAWGYGCGACPACELRAYGYKYYSAGTAA